MAEIKTVANEGSITDFLSTLPTEQQGDSQLLVAMMTDITGKPPVMWGTSIIGFDTMQYSRSDGQVFDWMRIGFSPRKGKLSLYVTTNADNYADDLEKVGKHQTGKGCIYIKKLADVDTQKLKEFIKKAYNDSKKN